MVPHHKVALSERGLKELGASSVAHYTKANHARFADGMWEGGFVVRSQIIFVPYAECKSWLYATNPYNGCAADGMLQCELVVPS